MAPFIGRPPCHASLADLTLPFTHLKCTLLRGKLYLESSQFQAIQTNSKPNTNLWINMFALRQNSVQSTITHIPNDQISPLNRNPDILTPIDKLIRAPDFDETPHRSVR